jgi:hypothetical protein
MVEKTVEIEINQVVRVLKGIHENGREWQILVVDEKYMSDRDIHKQLVEKYNLEVVNLGYLKK